MKYYVISSNGHNSTNIVGFDNGHDAANEVNKLSAKGFKASIIYGELKFSLS